LAAGLALPFIGRPLSASLVSQAQAQEKPVPFEAAAVRALARDLAQKPYKAPDNKLPDVLKDLTYDRYRMIRFKPDQAIWRAEGLPFQLQFFHRGFYYANRVDMFEVKDGLASRIVYSPNMFSFGDQPAPDIVGDLGFAGFRIHGPINKPDYFDEIGVFLGASYFRAVAKGQTYGLSARGLSLKTADPKGEEFPTFKAFWIERPAKGANSIVVHALLDSESATAAYRFTIRPGETTVYDIETTLFPRVQIDQPGLATLTSMYFFGPNDRGGVDDFRPAVHDSDGLGIQNGRGEQLWRPLSNPADLQVSAFVDNSPRGFGLMQRERNFHRYEDLEADRRLERRRSAAGGDSDLDRDQRQHRGVLAPAQSDARQRRIHLHLSHPLGRTDREAVAARAGHRNAHRRRGRGDPPDRDRLRRREPQNRAAGRHQGSGHQR
jgi:glucans biosynthesis protein